MRETAVDLVLTGTAAQKALHGFAVLAVMGQEPVLKAGSSLLSDTIE